MGIHFLVGKEAPNPHKRKGRGRMVWVSKRPVYKYDEMVRPRFSHMEIVNGTYRRKTTKQ